MGTPDSYNFSLFSPRNLHGKKNRNVILSMLLIWAVAVFGFQLLLRIIEKPTPEKALTLFESTWPAMRSGDLTDAGYKTFLNALVLVKGKNSVKPEDQQVISNAISCVTYNNLPEHIHALVTAGIAEMESLKAKLVTAKDQEYLDVKTSIVEKKKTLIDICEPYSGFIPGSLESEIFIGSLNNNYPASFDDNTYARLPAIMKLYLTHNQSVLTDTIFLGFPFHYFYTAVFLLILFIMLCIVYNLLIEWRLEKEGVVES
ncbi:MAG: hypothetical protein JXA72_05680 [Bacteroidales bacterium]|nr:hypothetical protein [Bacteroidales bacterium]